ncbi:MAG: tetratricopeptide repeat protein [Sphingomonas bacterium]|nr:ATP-binding protein [Sphingomonas bacterium]MDB5688497.1 tetratricopeptide repeat protein [Sphingomonas bacterium]
MAVKFVTRALLISVLMAGASAASGEPSSAAEATLDKARAAMIIDPREVIRLVGQARATLASEPDTHATGLARTRALWLESEALGRLGDLAGAERLAARALALVQRHEPEGKLHGDILMTQGAIALDRSQTQRAFALFRQAYAIFLKAGDTRAQAIALQNIGTIYSDAGDQRSVLRYYAQAAEVHRSDQGLAQTAANNLGTAYKELGDLPRADAQYRQALALARVVKSPVLEVRALNNLAAVALLRGRLPEAERYADRGLALARRASAAEWVPFLWGVKAQIALRKGDVAAAVALFGRTFAGADLTTTNFYFRDFHESASEAYRRNGDAEMALRHLHAFKRLDDEAREIRTSTNAALSAAQFDYSNQELKIARLNQAQLRARARLQQLGLSGSLLLLAITLGAFFWIRRSRNETRQVNRQLEKSNVALDKALQAKSEFLATTSHEIRTPLNGILGMTQVLMGRRELDGAVRDQVRLIDSAGNTMKAIVDDILDMAQIEQGRVQIERDIVALPALMRDTAGLWQGAAEQKGIRLELDLDAAPAAICEDQRKLRQIVFNLLSNAIKFTSTGTVTLRVSARGEDDAAQLILTVEDTGLGIAADQFELIFEPFRQADGGTTRQFGGTGLGLAISSKLAAALGGAITVTSEVGVGSTFTVALPLRRHAAPIVPERLTGRATSLADASVIVIEPNPLFASMIEACLEDEVRSLVAVESVGEVSGFADIVLFGEDLAAEELDTLRTGYPTALLILFGDAAEAASLSGGIDGAVAQAMPPLHLPAALGEYLGADIAPAAPVRAAA